MVVAIEKRFRDIKAEYNDAHFVSIETITKEDAEWLLQNMHQNRNEKPAQQEKLRSVLTEGEWAYPSFIVVSQKGELLDGQNRMHAIIDTNSTAQVVVAWNAPSESIHHIDTNVVRSMEDIFAIRGYKRSKEVPKVIKSLIMGNGLQRYKKDKAQGTLNKDKFKMIGIRIAINFQDYEQLYLDNQAIIDQVLDSYFRHKKKGVPFALMNIGAYMRSLASGFATLDTIERFFNIYFNPESGFNTDENAPFILRKRLSAAADRVTEASILGKYQMSEKAMKYFIEGKTLTEAQLSFSNVYQYEIFPYPAFDYYLPE